MIKKLRRARRISSPEPFVKYCPSDFGSIAIIWSVFKKKPKISQIAIPTPEMSAKQIVTQIFPGCSEGSCPEIDLLARQMKAFLSGKDIRFSLDLIRLDQCSPFQQNVLRAEYAIPRGRVSSYGLIAGYLNKPGGARAVGSALATNPFPIIIPCHRAVRSDGHLGGFQGGLAMKQALLKMEGITFSDDTHVDKKHFFYS